MRSFRHATMEYDRIGMTPVNKLAAVVSGMSKATKDSRHERNGRKNTTPEEDAEKLKVMLGVSYELAIKCLLKNANLQQRNEFVLAFGEKLLEAESEDTAEYLLSIRDKYPYLVREIQGGVK